MKFHYLLMLKRKASLQLTKKESKTIVLSENSSVEQFTELPEDLCLTKSVQKALMAKMMTLERKSIRRMGKLWTFHRRQIGVKLTSASSEAYRFSGMTLETWNVEEFDEETQAFLKGVSQFAEKREGRKYPQLLINLYMGPNDYIGQHSDNEKQLVPGSAIYSYSYSGGAVRHFCIHPATKGKRVQRLPMPHNSLLVMRGAMQKEFVHSVPRLGKREAQGYDESNCWRINITMRCFKI